MRRLVHTAVLRRFLTAREGATAIEYAIIATGIAGALIATVTTLGLSVTSMWASVEKIFN
jgi:pilus assembly protein Flp/PilA